MWVVGGEWYRKISIRVNIDGGGRGGGLLIEGGGVVYFTSTTGSKPTWARPIADPNKVVSSGG